MSDDEMLAPKAFHFEKSIYEVNNQPFKQKDTIFLPVTHIS
jgi:hypothetical protein